MVTSRILFTAKLRGRAVPEILTAGPEARLAQTTLGVAGFLLGSSLVGWHVSKLFCSSTPSARFFRNPQPAIRCLAKPNTGGQFGSLQVTFRLR
jgi:hypothetical protein